MRSFFFTFGVCVACAGEPLHEPRAEVRTPSTAVAIPPISTTSAPNVPSRFETRRIGASPKPVEHDHAGGRAIDLDVRDADLHDVLRLLADVGGVGIVVPGEITGRVTITLHRVPWRQALDTIVAAKGLGVERAGNILYVTRP